ncbi:hypothetical protein RHSIM_Rhsim03G0256200 [Rhododendron simsii]|uniref:poly(A)-specific ribonuclease n=1 Tax=Rhododendron simsii TaxID=118357 RepID=A0A834H8S2_RHOSS|nr:hypothetical protein RHSIM_Rhsim03G0256200 [Rhododendron simsii]
MAALPEIGAFDIREVWNDNLEDEFALIRGIVDDYTYIAMDTEFPGVVHTLNLNPTPQRYTDYGTLKANVDILKLIQLGLTFSDEKGNLPTCGVDKYCVWQFNFREFNVDEDTHNHASIELLQKAGLDFKMNKEKGVDANRFGELFMTSGALLNDNVQWVTFHSAYDFGYLVKLLTGQNLPNTLEEFLDLIKLYFPTLYDTKHLMKFCHDVHGGLNKVSEQLGVERVGAAHQAGSDSLLTCFTFMKLKKNFLNGSLERFSGVLHGLEAE